MLFLQQLLQVLDQKYAQCPSLSCFQDHSQPTEDDKPFPVDKPMRRNKDLVQKRQKSSGCVAETHRAYGVGSSEPLSVDTTISTVSYVSGHDDSIVHHSPISAGPSPARSVQSYKQQSKLPDDLLEEYREILTQQSQEKEASQTYAPCASSPSNPQAPPSATQEASMRYNLRALSSEQTANDAITNLVDLCWPVQHDEDNNDSLLQARRQELYQADIPTILLTVMNQFESSLVIQIEAYRVLANMAHESPSFCQTAVQLYALETILAGMKRFFYDEDVQVYGVGALSMLTRGSAQRSERLMVRLDGARVIVASIRAFPDCHDLQELTLILFTMLCEFPQIRIPLVKAGGLRVADEVLQRHCHDDQLVRLSRKAIAKFCHRDHVYDAEGKEIFPFFSQELEREILSHADL
jgi:hypothetical protein